MVLKERRSRLRYSGKHVVQLCCSAILTELGVGSLSSLANIPRSQSILFEVLFFSAPAVQCFQNDIYDDKE
ncbi:hypothetical protein A7E78_05100 [Syntrophotalea acetylenivorans]|uniref:Uncharacterized protein n=1 Tax=Syntrophotalea acetylenivorans TaxID=1842532 RepID=A0A1L3GMX0_9BACT|nr:hypothetical protein A7E78_05100 [Syntrophotalea acetylenivorans]